MKSLCKFYYPGLVRYTDQALLTAMFDSPFEIKLD